MHDQCKEFFFSTGLASGCEYISRIWQLQLPPTFNLDMQIGLVYQLTSGCTWVKVYLVVGCIHISRFWVNQVYKFNYGRPIGMSEVS